jgi:hypothetical protein
MKCYDDISEVHTFIFEAVCKDRTSAFKSDTQVHTELACRYSKDMFVFLGMSIADQRFYVPHMLYSKYSKVPFEQPLYWEITNSSQVSSMMRSMEDLIFGRITKLEYFEHHPPVNLPTDIDDVIIDFEGWVLMKIAVFDSEDTIHSEISRLTRIPLTIYSKIKTLAYYMSHKVKDKNIPYLIELGKVAGSIFPSAEAVYRLLPDGIINKILEDICADIIRKFDFSVGSKMMEQVQLIREKVMAQGDKDPLNGFDRRPLNSKYLSILAFNDKIIDGFVYDSFMKFLPKFPSDDEKDQYKEHLKIFKKLFIELKSKTKIIPS